MDLGYIFILYSQILIKGDIMVHSANNHPGPFAHLTQSIPDYSELIIAFLIFVLLLISIDEILDFVYIIQDVFTFKGMPF